jgi:hypothetical protein
MTGMTDTPDNEQAARVAHAQELMTSLGKFWRPMPADIEWVGTATPDGQKMIVMVISDASGRRGTGFTPEALEAHGNTALQMAGAGRNVSPGLQVVSSVPQGMPMPGNDPFKGGRP